MLKLGDFLNSFYRKGARVDAHKKEGVIKLVCCVVFVLFIGFCRMLEFIVLIIGKVMFGKNQEI